MSVEQLCSSGKLLFMSLCGSTEDSHQLDIDSLYNWKISEIVKMHVSSGRDEGMLVFKR